MASSSDRRSPFPYGETQWSPPRGSASPSDYMVETVFYSSEDEFDFDEDEELCSPEIYMPKPLPVSSQFVRPRLYRYREDRHPLSRGATPISIPTQRSCYRQEPKLTNRRLDVLENMLEVSSEWDHLMHGVQKAQLPQEIFSPESEQSTRSKQSEQSVQSEQSSPFVYNLSDKNGKKPATQFNGDAASMARRIYVERTYPPTGPVTSAMARRRQRWRSNDIAAVECSGDEEEPFDYLGLALREQRYKRAWEEKIGLESKVVRTALEAFELKEAERRERIHSRRDLPSYGDREGKLEDLYPSDGESAYSQTDEEHIDMTNIIDHDQSCHAAEYTPGPLSTKDDSSDGGEVDRYLSFKVPSGLTFEPTHRGPHQSPNPFRIQSAPASTTTTNTTNRTSTPVNLADRVLDLEMQLTETQDKLTTTESMLRESTEVYIDAVRRRHGAVMQSVYIGTMCIMGVGIVYTGMFLKG